MELACETPALELLSLDHATDRVARDAFGEVDRDGGACGEDLGEPQVGVGESRVAAELVVDDDDPDRTAARDQGDVDARANAQPPCVVLIDLGVVDDRVDAGACRRCSTCRSSLRAVDPLAEQAGSGVAAVDCRDAQLVAVRQSDQREPRLDQVAKAAADQLEHETDVGSPRRAI